MEIGSDLKITSAVMRNNCKIYIVFLIIFDNYNQFVFNKEFAAQNCTNHVESIINGHY